MDSEPVNPFPLIEIWADWRNKVKDENHEGDDMTSHPFFALHHDEEDLVLLAAALESACREAVAQSFGIEENFDPRLVATISDQLYDGRTAISCCLGITDAQSVIRLHALFRSIVDLVSASAEMQPSVATPSWHYSFGDSSVFIKIKDQSSGLQLRWRRYFKPEQWDVKDIGDLEQGVAGLRGRMEDIATRWTTLRNRFETMEKQLRCGRFLNQFLHEMDGMLSFLESGLSKCEARVSELQKESEANAAAKDFLGPGIGILKTNSMSTAIDIGQLESLSQRGRATGSLPNRTEVERPRRKLQKPRPGKTAIGEKDEKRVAKVAVIGMLIISLPFAAIATWRCEVAEELPQYDSNFHSTLCQMFLGLAGMLAIVAPILTEWQTNVVLPWQEPRYTSSRSAAELIPTSNPRLFNILLLLSTSTLLASAGTYPYSPIGSIPLGVAAGIAQNLATLLIIEGSGNKISQQFNEIEGGRVQIQSLETELADYRRG